MEKEASDPETVTHLDSKGQRDNTAKARMSLRILGGSSWGALSPGNEVIETETTLLSNPNPKPFSFLLHLPLYEGFNSVPPATPVYVHLKPQKVSLFENRVFAVVISCDEVILEQGQNMSI